MNNILNKTNTINLIIIITKNANKTRILFKITNILLIVFVLRQINIFYFTRKIGNDKLNPGEILESKYYDNFELMKSKYYNDSFLKPYLKEINILRYLYHKNYLQFKKNKNNIHICMSLNNRYVYQILVSFLSVLVNCNKEKTFITYHILCAPDVTEITLSILKSLIQKYFSNLEMIFYNMGNIFLNRIDPRISQAAYYRLLCPIILNLKKLIYLDGDTLTFKDLYSMYNIELNDNYILGFLDIRRKGVDFLGIKSEKCVNSGVILLNLEKIRKDNKIYDLINVVNSKIKLPSQDQTIMNYIFYPKIGILPSQYGIWNFNDKDDIKMYNLYLRTKININELEESLKDPAIVHNVWCWPKIWSRHSKINFGQQRGSNCTKYHNLWHSFAKKTNYYPEIYNITYK